MECRLIIRDSLPLTSPLDTNMGTRYHLLMGSRIDSTLNRSQTVASAKKVSIKHPTHPQAVPAGAEGAEAVQE